MNGKFLGLTSLICLSLAALGAAGCADGEESSEGLASAQQGARFKRELLASAPEGLARHLFRALRASYDKEWLDRRRALESGDPREVIGSGYPADDDEHRRPATLTLRNGATDAITCDKAKCTLDLPAAELSTGRIPDVLQRAILLYDPPNTLEGESSDAVLKGSEGTITCKTKSGGMMAMQVYQCNFDIPQAAR
jgi:hypothetical protein